MTRVIAKEKILIQDDSGPCSLRGSAYIFVAAEAGDQGIIVGNEGDCALVAFEKTRLLALVEPERLIEIET